MENCFFLLLLHCHFFWFWEFQNRKFCSLTIFAENSWKYEFMPSLYMEWFLIVCTNFAYDIYFAKFCFFIHYTFMLFVIETVNQKCN